MTNKEAVEILKGIADGTACLMPDMPRRGEIAIDMAINALEQPECDDAVSRKAAIDALPYLLDYEGFKGESGYVSKNLVRTMLKELPSVTPAQPGWIPCSERLPGEADYKGCSECIDGAVWYYTDKGAMGLGYYYESTKAWSTTYDESPYGEVIAWMPPPIEP